MRFKLPIEMNDIQELTYSQFFTHTHTAGIYLFKRCNGNSTKFSEICSKLTIKRIERRP